MLGMTSSALRVRSPFSSAKPRPVSISGKPASVSPSPNPAPKPRPAFFKPKPDKPKPMFSLLLDRMNWKSGEWELKTKDHGNRTVGFIPFGELTRKNVAVAISDSPVDTPKGRYYWTGMANGWALQSDVQPGPSPDNANIPLVPPVPPVTAPETPQTSEQAQPSAPVYSGGGGGGGESAPVQEQTDQIDNKYPTAEEQPTGAGGKIALVAGAIGVAVFAFMGGK